MTPYEIHILLHYYACADDYKDRGEPIFADTMRGFEAKGLIRRTDPADPRWVTRGQPVFEATDRLRCYAAALQDVPLPTWRVEFPKEAA